MRNLARFAVATAVAGSSLALGVGPASADPPTPRAAGTQAVGTCTPGYRDPGAFGLEDLQRLPRLVAGLEAGTYDVAELTAQFHLVDANGDGTICAKAVSPLRGSSTKNWSAFYLVQDNKHPR